MSASSGHGGGDPFSSDSAPISDPVMSARSTAALQRARDRNPHASWKAVVRDALAKDFSSFRTKKGEDVDLEFCNRQSIFAVKTRDVKKRDGPGDSVALPIFDSMGMPFIKQLGSPLTAYLIDERVRPFALTKRERESKAIDDAYCADRDRVIVFRSDVPAFMDILFSRFELLSSIGEWGDDVEAKKQGQKAANAKRGRAENNAAGINPRSSKKAREAYKAAREIDSEEGSSSELHPAAGEEGSSAFPSSSLPRSDSSASDSARDHTAAGGSEDIE